MKFEKVSDTFEHPRLKRWSFNWGHYSFFSVLLLSFFCSVPPFMFIKTQPQRSLGQLQNSRQISVLRTWDNQICSSGGVADNMSACRPWFCRSDGVKRSKLVHLPQGFWKPIQLLSGFSRSWRHPSPATWLIPWTRSWTLRTTRGWTRLPRGGGWAPPASTCPWPCQNSDRVSLSRDRCYTCKICHWV